MTLKYSHPKLTQTKQGTCMWTDVVHWTSSVPDATPLEDLLNENFQAILAGAGAHNKIKSPTARGRYLEMCIYDFIARVVLEEGGSLDRIELHVDMRDGKHAEADFLIYRKLAVLVKVSLRERWKQVDRDAGLMQNGYGRRKGGFLVHTLFYAEKDSDDFRQARKKASSVMSQCAAEIIAVSIKDPEYLREYIIPEIRAVVQLYGKEAP